MFPCAGYNIKILYACAYIHFLLIYNKNLPGINYYKFWSIKRVYIRPPKTTLYFKILDPTPSL